MSIFCPELSAGIVSLPLPLDDAAAAELVPKFAVIERADVVACTPRIVCLLELAVAFAELTQLAALLKELSHSVLFSAVVARRYTHLVWKRQRQRALIPHDTALRQVREHSNCFRFELVFQVQHTLFAGELLRE